MPLRLNLAVIIASRVETEVEGLRHAGLVVKDKPSERAWAGACHIGSLRRRLHHLTIPDGTAAQVLVDLLATALRQPFTIGGDLTHFRHLHSLIAQRFHSVTKHACLWLVLRLWSGSFNTDWT